MKIVFHVGMGKTGTSSIQKALLSNSAQLLENRIRYLGMWFGALRSEVTEPEGVKSFFRLSPEEMQERAKQFSEQIQADAEATGFDYYILSNESFFTHASAMAPFFAELEKHINVSFICYAREVRDWLPSAYHQWALFHKTYEGPIRPYKDFARQLIKTFHGLLVWKENFPETFELRRFSKDIDVVDDFSRTLNLDLAEPASRFLVRAETSESVLRAIFNSQRPGPVLPLAFNMVFRGINFGDSIKIDDLVDQSFDYSETDEIISENSELFEAIEEFYGIDLIPDTAPKKEAIPVNVQDLRNRLLDHVLQIVMLQASKINALEKKVRQLEEREQTDATTPIRMSQIE